MPPPLRTGAPVGVCLEANFAALEGVFEVAGSLAISSLHLLKLVFS
jgi:hypothetical protein